MAPNPADYPPTAFHYAVRLAGSQSAADSRFKEASGLGVELGVEEQVEGGENRFRHRLPTAPKYSNLVLKRGLLVAAQPFFNWCKETLQNNFASRISPKGVQLVLLDEKAQPLKTWSLYNAFPVKWSTSDFNAVEGQVLIESVELTYQYFEVK
jgi:phage tail-like protein